MNTSIGNIFKGDKTIWMVFFFLCLISIVEVYSALAMLTFKGGSYIMPMVKHIGLLLGGLMTMVVTSYIGCGFFRKLVTPGIIVSIGLLAWVLVAGASTNGAQRWINLLGIPFQPSEIAKGSVVIATAHILSLLQTDKGADPLAFKYTLTVCFMILPLIMLENLSTAMLLGMVVVMMMFIGRVPMKQLGGLIGTVLGIGIVIVAMVMLLGKDQKQMAQQQVLTEQIEQDMPKEKSSLEKVFHRFDTWKARIEKFADSKEVAPDKVDLDRNAQESYAKIAIASSNIVGKGPGNSEECNFLPQAYSDFIYAIIIEEMGIIGAFGVAMLYIILLFRTGRIVSHCENSFPAYLAMGLALLLVTQALFNMMVAVGVVPVTGQPLPLISKGGTSTIINCFYLGIILSISRSAQRKHEMIIEPVTASGDSDSEPLTEN